MVLPRLLILALISLSLQAQNLYNEFESLELTPTEFYEPDITDFSSESKEEPAEELFPDVCAKPAPSASRPRWYFALQPGYYGFTDASMREFYANGGFTLRGEVGCQVWGPLVVWVDGGYFQKEGKAIGGPEKTDILLGTLTLGLKALRYCNDFFALYAGAGPRLFMMKLHNESPHVPAEDNQVGIGGGFNAGCWIFPWARSNTYSRNLFFNLFADYSLSTLRVEEDELSSETFDINVSGLTVGAGLGIRF